MSEYEPTSSEPDAPPWARLLFGDEPWLMLLALLACGLITYILAREAIPAILAVVLAGLAANAWWARHAEPADEGERQT